MFFKRNELILLKVAESGSVVCILTLVSTASYPAQTNRILKNENPVILNTQLEKQLEAFNKYYLL